VPGQAQDSRWLHRPKMDWARVAEAETDPGSIPGRVLAGVRHILGARAATREFHGAVPTEVIETGNTAVFGIARRAPTGPVLCLFNFSEAPQRVAVDGLRAEGAERLVDILTGAEPELAEGALVLPPYAALWLR